MSLIPTTHWIEKITSGLFCQKKKKKKCRNSSTKIKLHLFASIIKLYFSLGRKYGLSVKQLHTRADIFISLFLEETG